MDKNQVTEKLIYILKSFNLIDTTIEKYIKYFEEKITKEEVPLNIIKIKFIHPDHIGKTKSILAKIDHIEYKSKIYEILFCLNYRFLFKVLGFDKPCKEFFEILISKYNADINFFFFKFLKNFLNEYDFDKKILSQFTKLQKSIEKKDNVKPLLSKFYHLIFEKKFTKENLESIIPILIPTFLYSINFIEKKDNEHIEFIQNIILKEHPDKKILCNYIEGKENLDFKQFCDIVSHKRIYHRDHFNNIHKETLQNIVFFIFDLSIPELSRLVNILLINNYYFFNSSYSDAWIFLPFEKYFENYSNLEKIKFYKNYFLSQNIPEQFFIYQILQEKLIKEEEDNEFFLEYIKSYFEERKNENDVYKLSKEGKKHFKFYFDNFDIEKKYKLNEAYKEITGKHYNNFFIEIFNSSYKNYLKEDIKMNDSDIKKVFEYFNDKIKFEDLPEISGQWNLNFYFTHRTFSYRLLKLLENYAFKYFKKYIKFEMKKFNRTVLDVFFQDITTKINLEEYSKYGLNETDINETAFHYFTHYWYTYQKIAEQFFENTRTNDKPLKFIYHKIKKNKKSSEYRKIILYLKKEAKYRKITLKKLLNTLTIEDYGIDDYGLDKYGSKIFSYGTREFKVTLIDQGKLEILDIEKNKILKSLPKPNQTDNVTIAENFREKFKRLKKNIKTNYKTQVHFLENNLIENEKWNKSSFMNIFINNPVMREFGTNLVWGTYNEEDDIINTFRCLEDGTLTTYDNDEFELSETDIIGLVHPIELDKEILESWKEQLEDYEIIQPIDQLHRVVYREEKRYENKKPLEREIDRRLRRYGWERGKVLDHGRFYKYTYRSLKKEIVVKIVHSGIKLRNYENKELEIKEIIFYDLPNYNKIENIKNIPKRFYSEIIRQLEEVTY